MEVAEILVTDKSAPRAARWNLHRYANPGQFLRLSQPLVPPLATIGGMGIVVGLVWGLCFAPPDWQQGDAVRMMYVHVPAAWLATLGYFALALCAVASIVWRHPLADLAAKEIAPIGAAFTGLCLVTGSLWGKPTWGTYWVWDARLTSMAVLFCLYVGHIVVMRAFGDAERGRRAAAILALVGAIDLPIIKFSVQWWNTLHQPDTIHLFGATTMPASMLDPLLISAFGFSLVFAALTISRMRSAIIERKAESLLTAGARTEGAQLGAQA